MLNLSVSHIPGTVDACPMNGQMHLRFRVQKGMIQSAKLVYNCDKNKWHEFRDEAEMRITHTDSELEYYSVAVPLTDTRFSYIFELQCSDGQTRYLSEEGLTGSYDHSLGYLPIYEMECYEQIPQSAWNAYATEMNGETFYCGIPLNVQSGMLYYIESMLPDNWETEWDINSNCTPDFFESYTALYAYSELCKEGGEKTQYGYLDETVDTYFMSGYLFTYGGYIFGNNGTDAGDIGLASGESYKGARMIQQWAGQMNNTEVLDNTFSSAAYQYLADGVMLCTITTPDVSRMFIRSMVSTGNWTEEEAKADLKMITVPRLPVSADLTAENWQDTITKMDELTVETTMMGGINGYGISAYTDYPNASLAFVEFATSYEQAVLRNQYLGVAPARADAAATISETDATVGILFDRLDRGLISIMPAITEIGQLWTPAESFLIDLSTDPYRAERGEERLYDTDEKIQAGLERLVTQIRDAIETLA